MRSMCTVWRWLGGNCRHPRWSARTELEGLWEYLGLPGSYMIHGNKWGLVCGLPCIGGTSKAYTWCGPIGSHLSLLATYNLLFKWMSVETEYNSYDFTNFPWQYVVKELSKTNVIPKVINKLLTSRHVKVHDKHFFQCFRWHFLKHLKLLQYYLFWCGREKWNWNKARKSFINITLSNL